tara:strand:+ start:7249 stop:7383 length:135 start_codon:yes stop_codon:yes gene_type:complete
MGNYEAAIHWVDTTEHDYLEQGYRNDDSCYSFDELMEELNNEGH